MLSVLPFCTILLLFLLYSLHFYLLCYLSMATVYTSPSVVDEVDDKSVLSSPSGRGYRQPDLLDKVVFTASIQRDFLRYIKEERSTLFTYYKLWEFKFFLEYPDQLLGSKNLIQQAQYQQNCIYAKCSFELQDRYLYCKAEEKLDSNSIAIRIPPRYIATDKTAFEFVTDIYRNLQYFSIYKTYKQVAEWYYRITCTQVQFIVNRCIIYNLKKSAKSKAPPIPIVSTCCLNRVYIDLIDFRTTPEKGYCWILQIKDHFL
jgi:hypothetical protein